MRVVRTPGQLAEAVRVAYVSAIEAGTASALTVEDLLSGAVDPRAAVRDYRDAPSRRRDHYPIGAWSPLPGGAWRSPVGRTFGPDTHMAAVIWAKWLDSGLDLPPEHGAAS